MPIKAHLIKAEDSRISLAKIGIKLADQIRVRNVSTTVGMHGDVGDRTIVHFTISGEFMMNNVSREGPTYKIADPVSELKTTEGKIEVIEQLRKLG